MRRLFSLFYSINMMAGLCVLTLIASCSKVDSEDIKSSGMYADIDVISTGANTTQVTVDLKTGSSIDDAGIKLSGGDKLTSTAMGVTKILVRDYYYKTTFPSDESYEYVISLERSSDNSMPNSRVTLPEKFEIQSPTSSQQYNSGETINITWSPVVVSKTVEFSYSVNCTSIHGNVMKLSDSNNIGDSGTSTITVDSILNSEGSANEIDNNIACSSTITIKRANSGIIDPNYGKGGDIVAKQIRKVVFLINP